MFSDSTINWTETIITGEILMDTEAIQVYGAKWCGVCFRVRMILDHQHINPLVIDIEHGENAKAFVSQGCVVVPTNLFNDGSVLVEPTNLQPRSKLGLKTSKSK